MLKASFDFNKIIEFWETRENAEKSKYNVDKPNLYNATLEDVNSPDCGLSQVNEEIVKIEKGIEENYYNSGSGNETIRSFENEYEDCLGKDSSLKEDHSSGLEGYSLMLEDGFPLSADHALGVLSKELIPLKKPVINCYPGVIRDIFENSPSRFYEMSQCHSELSSVDELFKRLTGKNQFEDQNINIPPYSTNKYHIETICKDRNYIFDEMEQNLAKEGVELKSPNISPEFATIHKDVNVTGNLKFGSVSHENYPDYKGNENSFITTIDTIEHSKYHIKN